MPEWAIAYLGSVQRGIVDDLSSELRAGGLATAMLAFALGAQHALTPGHGKTAVAACFVARDARPAAGMLVALSAAMLHVLSGLAAFLILRFVVGHAAGINGREPSAFSLVGYGLIVTAGVIMVVQSPRRATAASADAGVLTAGIGLLPCPLTVSVLGFAWTQSSWSMVALVLIALALGVATTIGAVAAAAIVARIGIGAALAGRLPAVKLWGWRLQGVAGLCIIAIGAVTLATLR